MRAPSHFLPTPKRLASFIATFTPFLELLSSPLGAAAARARAQAHSPVLDRRTIARMHTSAMQFCTNCACVQSNQSHFKFDHAGLRSRTSMLLPGSAAVVVLASSRSRAGADDELGHVRVHVHDLQPRPACA